MTPEQTELVQKTWEQLRPCHEAAAELFYGRLFECHPELREYFRSDMQRQRRMLVKMLDVAVAGLDDLDALVAPLERLGAAHVGYGVRDEDYDKVGAALLWTLEQGLEDDFTEATAEAGATAYGTLAGVMKAGSAAAAA